MQILQALRARCVRNFCRNSSKSARCSSEKTRAFSARIAPHDHQNHSHRCRASAWTFSRPCACFAIAARAWRTDLRSKPMQNRAVRAEKLGKNPRKSAQNARKTCGTSVNAFPECFLRQSDNEDVFAQILQALRVRCARNFCKNSSKSARFSSEKTSAFSARIAPHDHQNHCHR